MAKYIIEFKKTDVDGYIHTKRTVDNVENAQNDVKTLLGNGGDFDYLVVRQVKEVKPKVGDKVKVQAGKVTEVK